MLKNYRRKLRIWATNYGRDAGWIGEINAMFRSRTAVSGDRSNGIPQWNQPREALMVQQAVRPEAMPCQPL